MARRPSLQRLLALVAALATVATCGILVLAAFGQSSERLWQTATGHKERGHGGNCDYEVGPCPMARCSPPRPGCRYKVPGDLYRGPMGQCCPSLCQLMCDANMSNDSEAAAGTPVELPSLQQMDVARNETAEELDRNKSSANEPNGTAYDAVLLNETKISNSQVLGSPCNERSRNCPQAKCAAPPSGCHYNASLQWTEDGCCPALCLLQCTAARPEESGRPAVIEEPASRNESAAAIASSALLASMSRRLAQEDGGGAFRTMDGSVCNKESGNCPMADCEAPMQGCDYKLPGDLKWTKDGCCPQMCQVQCGDDPPQDTAVSTPAAGIRCTKQSGSCPMAKCAAPPEGCDYKLPADLWLSEAGDCCPEICQLQCGDVHAHALAGSIASVKVHNDVEEQDTSVGSPCPRESGNCIMASCVPAPPGCSYKLPGDLRWTQEGDCCPEVCQLQCGGASGVKGLALASAIVASRVWLA